MGRLPRAANAVVPGAPAGVRWRVGWRAEIAAGPEDPDEKKQTDDGPDDDTGDGAAREGLGVCGLFVSARVIWVVVGYNDLPPGES